MRARKVSPTVLEADIHGMYEEDARHYLEGLLSHPGKGIEEILVIHGYSHGQVLQNMVRCKLKHPRLAGKLVSLNPGATRLLLRRL